MTPPRLVVEADGGSRGNPGIAAGGAVVWNEATGELLCEVGVYVGIATNNVASDNQTLMISSNRFFLDVATDMCSRRLQCNMLRTYPWPKNFHDESSCKR